MRPMPVRPMLKPALRRVWRDTATVQLGVDPETAVLLADVDREAAQVLDLLDGTRDTSEVLSHAASLGCDPGPCAPPARPAGVQ